MNFNILYMGVSERKEDMADMSGDYDGMCTVNFENFSEINIKIIENYAKKLVNYSKFVNVVDYGIYNAGSQTYNKTRFNST